MTESSIIHISGLRRDNLATLRKQAKTLGMSAEGYARQLIEDGLSLERRARTETLDQIMGSVQARFQKSGMTEEELDTLVDAARTRHFRRISR